MDFSTVPIKDLKFNTPVPYQPHVNRDFLNTTKQKLVLARYPQEQTDFGENSWAQGAKVARVKQSQYRDILKPNYEPGCKRRVNTATYLSCLHSTNMLLKKDSVIKISPNSVSTQTGETYPADAIIYATGFQTQKWLHPISIKGRNGKDLHQAWDAAGGAEAYKGTTVTDFPNFFILHGPNVATGQHSVIFHSECQMNYTCRLLRPVLCGDAKSIMVKPAAQKKDLSWVHGKLKNLVFNSGCSSWWMDPVTKKNTFIYPDPMYKYWLRTIFPRWSDFDIEWTKRSSTGKVLLGMAPIGMAAFAVASRRENWISFIQ